MSYTEQTLVAERFALLNGEEVGDVLAWLVGPQFGEVEYDEH